MSDEPTGRDVEALAGVIADAICGEKPSYSPDHACTAHRIQAERAAVALAPLLAQARREGTAEVERALAAAFSGDEYEENAAAAAGEGEWSWFKWLATTTAAALRGDA